MVDLKFLLILMIYQLFSSRDDIACYIDSNLAMIPSLSHRKDRLEDCDEPASQNQVNDRKTLKENSTISFINNCIDTVIHAHDRGVYVRSSKFLVRDFFSGAMDF